MPWAQIIKFSGRITLNARQDNIDVDPRSRHSTFYLKLSSTVCRDFPPYLTIVSWMIMVATTITKNNLLLKKFSNTLYSWFFSFLAFISLKTCSNTKTLKKIE